MGTGVFRHRGKDRQAATYWRRRFVALVAGLAVLTLIAWAVSGALNGSALRLAATGASSGDRASGQSGPGAGGAGAGATAAGTGSKSARAANPATGASGHRPTAAASPAPASAASRGHPPGGAGQSGTCRPGGVVLSLSSSQESFGSRQLPVFDLSVVSTLPRTCTFNVGAKYLMLVIRAGRTRIWGSADCVEGQGSLITDLRRGVPTVLPVSWDRETSSPGCEIASAQVRPGAYTATVIAGADVGNTETFRLR